MPERLIPGRPSLQAERTDLSWSRTALAAMINGGLLLPGHDLRGPGSLQLAGGILAFLLAVFMLAISAQRRAALTRHRSRVLAGTLPIALLGGGTAVLGGVTLAVIAFA
jgi:uncharacterized membrane protein YidH (DUF202 family)